MEDNWYSKPREELLQKLKTNAEYGLSNVEIIKRQQTHGLNELRKGKKISPLSIFMQQFKNSLVLILLFALAISIIIGLLSEDDVQRFEYLIDSMAISTIILFNSIFGFIQEYKAEKSLEALESMVTQFTTVTREGEKERVESRNIVPGDIVLLEEGERIPADARILQSHSLRVDESALTGESFPVSKDGTVNVQLNVPIGDRINSIYKGTIITGGRVLAVITETGMKTVFGQIAESLLEEKKEETKPEAEEAKEEVDLAEAEKTFNELLNLGKVTPAEKELLLPLLASDTTIDLGEGKTITSRKSLVEYLKKQPSKFSLAEEGTSEPPKEEEKKEKDEEIPEDIDTALSDMQLGDTPEEKQEIYKEFKKEKEKEKESTPF